MAKKSKFTVVGKNKLGVQVANSMTGQSVTLLNPYGKGRKYALELKNNVAVTNDGVVKVDKKNKPKRLTKQQRAFRAGYLQARTDSAKAFKSKSNNKYLISQK